jgi:hypothetical protein
MGCFSKIINIQCSILMKRITPLPGIEDRVERLIEYSNTIAVINLLIVTSGKQT